MSAGGWSSPSCLSQSPSVSVVATTTNSEAVKPNLRPLSKCSICHLTKERPSSESIPRPLPNRFLYACYRRTGVSGFCDNNGIPVGTDLTLTNCRCCALCGAKYFASEADNGYKNWNLCVERDIAATLTATTALISSTVISNVVLPRDAYLPSGIYVIFNRNCPFDPVEPGSKISIPLGNPAPIPEAVSGTVQICGEC